MPYNFDEQFPYQGHQPNPQPHSYHQPPVFYQQLQQHAAQQYQGSPYQLPSQLPNQQQSPLPNFHQPHHHQQPQSSYQASPQTESNFQVIIPSRNSQAQYNALAHNHQYQQVLPQHLPNQAQFQQGHPLPQYQTSQQPQHQTSPYQEYRQPLPQPGYHHNQQFVPPQQSQYRRPPQSQQPVNGSSAMPASQPAPRPTSNTQRTEQNGHVPTPPPSQSPAVARSPALPPVPEPAYPPLLLSLADEYLLTATKIDEKSETYFKLIATGLGCLESVLNNFKLAPLREAQISLRYAQVLYEETENYDDAERILTKAIDICERNKFLDLKYTMQLLLACVLYQSKPKAAIKDLLTMLEEIEAYKHTAWEYASRYQLAMFYLSTPAVRDLHNGIHHIEKLSNAAKSNGDKCVAAFADVVCALLHLQTSSPDAVSSSQQSLAKARGLSTDEDVSSIHQIMLMMEIADLCCSIREYNYVQCDEKRRRMQNTWSAIMDKEAWVSDGDMMYLPIKQNSLRGVQLQMGGLVTKKEGRYLLPFSWMDTNDAEAWGFLLSAITKARKNVSDGGKAEEFIEHGLLRTRDTTTSINGRVGATSPQQKILECRFLVEYAFLKCQKGEWNDADKAVNKIDKLSEELGDGTPKSMVYIIQYLRGTIHQGSGHLDDALEVYQAHMFDLGQFTRGAEPSSGHHRSQDSESETIRNITIIAAINQLLIIGDEFHPQYNRVSAITDELSGLVSACHDNNIHAAYTLIHSLISPNGILRSKKSLITALNSAKALCNAQITSLVLITMYQKYFLGLIDENAVKCVRATSSQMKVWGNPMWMHVAAGVEAEAWEFQGKSAEAEVKLGEAKKAS